MIIRYDMRIVYSVHAQNKLGTSKVTKSYNNDINIFRFVKKKKSRLPKHDSWRYKTVMVHFVWKLYYLLFK